MGILKDLNTRVEELLNSEDPLENAKGEGMKEILDKLNEESYVNKIDWSELRNQKGTLLETINYIDEVDIEINNQDKTDTVNELTGILHLIDALQDFAVDELDVNPMHVYDFEAEESRDD